MEESFTMIAERLLLMLDSEQDFIWWFSWHKMLFDEQKKPEMWWSLGSLTVVVPQNNCWKFLSYSADWNGRLGTEWRQKRLVDRSSIAQFPSHLWRITYHLHSFIGDTPKKKSLYWDPLQCKKGVFNKFFWHFYDDGGHILKKCELKIAFLSKSLFNSLGIGSRWKNAVGLYMWCRKCSGRVWNGLLALFHPVPSCCFPRPSWQLFARHFWCTGNARLWVWVAVR